MKRPPSFDSQVPGGCLWIIGAAFVGVGLGSVYEPGVGGLAFGVLLLVAAIADWLL